MLVRDLMAERRFQVVHKDTVISEVAGIFEAEKISGAPLVDDTGEVVGMITKSDIVHFEFVGGDPFVGRAWEIARRRIKTIREDASIKEAAQAMLEDHIHRLMVVDDEDEPIGMLTSFDYVRHIAES